MSEQKIMSVDDPIPWQLALPLINYYNSNTNSFPISDNDGTKLESFFFQKTVIRTIINQTGLDAIYFALAYNSGAVVSTANVGYTIIAIGMKNNELLLGNSSIIHDSQTNQGLTVRNAKLLIKDYQDGNGQGNRPTISTSFKSGRHSETAFLKGFVMSKKDLNGFFSTGNTAVNIELILAYHNHFKHGPLGNEKNVQKGLTLVVVGNTTQSSNNRLIRVIDPVYDYCDPCPQVCPSNIRDITIIT